MVGNPRPLDFTGVVLAGGDSRRFGEADKALAVVDGAALVERVADAVRAVTGDPPVIAVNRDDQRDAIEGTLESPPKFAFDAASFDGPLAGVYGSLSAVGDEWLFLTGCDMPRLDPAAIAWLADRLRARSPSPDALVPVDSDGELEPLHAFYRRDAVADAERRLRSDAGLRALLDALPDTATVPIRAAPSDASLAASVANVNTEREYRRVRGAIERGSARRPDDASRS